MTEADVKATITIPLLRDRKMFKVVDEVVDNCLAAEITYALVLSPSELIIKFYNEEDKFTYIMSYL